MTDILDEMEERRLALGLTQFAVAQELGITQPHYSKVVGRAVPLVSDLQDRMAGWLKDRPPPPDAPRQDSEILDLTRAIERQSRRLAVLLTRKGKAAPRRRLGRTRSRAGG